MFVLCLVQLFSVCVHVTVYIMIVCICLLVDRGYNTLLQLQRSNGAWDLSSVLLAQIKLLVNTHSKPVPNVNRSELVKCLQTAKDNSKLKKLSVFTKSLIPSTAEVLATLLMLAVLRRYFHSKRAEWQFICMYVCVVCMYVCVCCAWCMYVHIKCLLSMIL